MAELDRGDGGAEGEVRAAGGVVWRGRPGATEILVIHRDRYDDWTIPKGKLDPGESWELAAVREVWEETGIVGLLGDELGEVRYDDHRGRAKVVRYWLMEVAADSGFEAGDEVSQRRWITAGDAPRVLTHQHDVDLVHRAIEVLRHT